MGTLLLRHPSPRRIPPESVPPVALPWISMPVHRRSFLLSGVAAPFVQTRKRSTARPNVVLFMTDDHGAWATGAYRSEEHTSELQSLRHLVCRLLLEKKTDVH